MFVPLQFNKGNLARLLTAFGIPTTTTGSGSVVLNTSPTLVTPILGVAAATSISFGDEALSAYDEGSWTPVLAGTTTPGTQSYTTQVGRYIRIGNTVTVWGDILLSALGGTAAGNAIITGLPFAASNVSGLRFAITLGATGGITFTASYTYLTADIITTLSRIDLGQVGSAQATLPLPITAFSNTGFIVFGGSYRIN